LLGLYGVGDRRMNDYGMIIAGVGVGAGRGGAGKN